MQFFCVMSDAKNSTGIFLIKMIDIEIIEEYNLNRC